MSASPTLSGWISFYGELSQAERAAPPRILCRPSNFEPVANKREEYFQGLWRRESLGLDRQLAPSLFMTDPNWSLPFYSP